MSKFITDELVEERLIKKGFGEQDSHDEEHVKKVVCKHYDLEITDDWSNNCDHYIYEETTADGYSVWVSTYMQDKVSVSENVFYYDNDLADQFKTAVYDNDHGDVKIYVDDIHEDNYWLQDAIRDLYVELVDVYTDMVRDELIDEGYEDLPTDEQTSIDLLNLLANNE